ncbi:DUF1801 domain-containing protein [Catenovulum maritimum]|uniref:YdhG-like domain-containing protein n=1 Tax=Catenovulum maritimum TaxID=1513271 RepID=A0A0J8GV79_9ALTE|nr:DUF1801 domain-containing protein [Catenovulum maritimum]KMT66642.1 hypothetical protein XM47_00440 [Catenovulum maritimum]
MQFEKDLTSPYKDLFIYVRDYLLSFDGVTEIKKDKITTYSFSGSALCHLRTMPHGVDIGFLKGAFIEDSLGQLHGKTKRMRVLSIETIEADSIDFYIKAALKLNA